MNRKQIPKRKWHICRDCIAPIADGLQNTVDKWNRFFNLARRHALEAEYRPITEIEMFGGELNDAQRKRRDELVRALEAMEEPPQPRDIERLYDDYHVKPALNWLKVFMSVEFAKDFESRLCEPLRHFHRLYFRACQILDGDETGTSTEAIVYQYAVQRVLEWRSAMWRLTDKGREEIEDPILDEMEEGYCEVEHELRETIAYLRDVSALLRVKIERAKADRKPGVGRRGRPRKTGLYQRLRELRDRHRTGNDWARLAKLASEDEQALDLNKGKEITRDVARYAIKGSRKKRGEKAG